MRLPSSKVIPVSKWAPPRQTPGSGFLQGITHNLTHMPTYITLALPSLGTPPLLTCSTPKSHSQTGPRLSVLSTFSASHWDYTFKFQQTFRTMSHPSFPSLSTLSWLHILPSPWRPHVTTWTAFSPAPELLGLCLSAWPPTLPQSDHLSASPTSRRMTITAEARGTAGETGASPQLGEPSSAQASELSFGFHLSCISYLSLSSFSSSQAPMPLSISASS